jgi:hypothetical protein
MFSKHFLKKLNFFLFFKLIFLVFSCSFDVLISEIIFLKYFFDIFINKNTLNINHNHNIKQVIYLNSCAKAHVVHEEQGDHNE